jgi:hypothetical protein
VTILAPTAPTSILTAAVIAEDRSVVMHNRSRTLVIAGLVPMLVALFSPLRRRRGWRSHRPVDVVGCNLRLVARRWAIGLRAMLR